MSTTRAESAFENVPAVWFEPVVGVWVTLLSVFGTGLVLAGGDGMLDPEAIAAVPMLGVVAATAVGVLAYVVFGFGLARVYRDYRGFDRRVHLGPPTRTELGWVGLLVGVGLLAVALTTVWIRLAGAPTDLVVPIIDLGIPALGPHTGLTLGFAGVNEIVNAAPMVLWVALLAGTVVGPAIAAVVHGVLQDTLARVTRPEVAVGATALLATILIENSAFSSILTTHEAVSAVIVGAFVLGVAVAYRTTENLRVAMAAYGLFNALAVVIAWVDLMASLYAAGHLFT